MNQQRQVNADVTKIRNERCSQEGCGNMFWEKTYILKLIPGLMIGQSQAICAPVEVYCCTKCKAVHPNMIVALTEPKPVLQ